MTTNLVPVKQNPEASRDDLRRMSQTINEMIKVGNRGFLERKSQTSTGTPVADDGTASIYYIDTTDANVVFNMAGLSGVQDRYITVAKISTDVNTVTCTPASTAQFIDGSSNKVISSFNVSHDFHARDTTNWKIL
jgi:hypothetical protein